MGGGCWGVAGRGGYVQGVSSEGRGWGHPPAPPHTPKGGASPSPKALGAGARHRLQQLQTGGGLVSAGEGRGGPLFPTTGTTWETRRCHHSCHHGAKPPALPNAGVSPPGAWGPRRGGRAGARKGGRGRAPALCWGAARGCRAAGRRVAEHPSAMQYCDSVTRCPHVLGTRGEHPLGTVTKVDAAPRRSSCPAPPKTLNPSCSEGERALG